MVGGAYKEFDGTAKVAKEMGARACEALFGERYTEVEVFRCRKAWSPWFHDVAWVPLALRSIVAFRKYRYDGY